MTRSYALAGAILVASMLQGCAELDHFPGSLGSGCKSTGGVCKVDIGVPSGCTSGACVTLSRDPVHVGDGTGKARDVNLLWRLPQGYAFCEGDGISFKEGPGRQFSDPYATNDPNGGRGSGSGSKKNFHWKDANSAKGTFGYGFRFHADGCTGNAFEKDPGVVNDM